MYETLYKGAVVPSGFYLKFSISGWTPIFGASDLNNLRPKKWNVSGVVGKRAQLFGVTYDNLGQADFLSFNVCSGPLLAAP